ncbi:MAG: hypothetical protein LBI39_00095 [Puniceicoccales bacterium]|jgi:hypothetical protein|nr:hypothetical protein [Puniceicoccales bacterium]
MGYFYVCGEENVPVRRQCIIGSKILHLPRSSSSAVSFGSNTFPIARQKLSTSGKISTGRRSKFFDGALLQDVGNELLPFAEANPIVHLEDVMITTKILEAHSGRIHSGVPRGDGRQRP